MTAHPILQSDRPSQDPLAGSIRSASLVFSRFALYAGIAYVQCETLPSIFFALASAGPEPAAEIAIQSALSRSIRRRSTVSPSKVVNDAVTTFLSGTGNSPAGLTSSRSRVSSAVAGPLVAVSLLNLASAGASSTANFASGAERLLTSLL